MSLADVAKMLPATFYSFTTNDLKQLREDADLAVLHDSWVEAQVFWMMETATGLVASAVHTWTEAHGMDESVCIYEAEFDVGDVRDRLDQNGYQDEYGGVDVWVLEVFGEGYISVAMMESMIILGTLEGVNQCIDTIGGTGGSLYDGPDVAEVLSRLSPGFSGSVMTRDPELSGLQASAYCWSKASPDSVECNMLAAFEDDASAEAAIHFMEDTFEDMPDQVKPSGYHIEQQGRFVELRVDMDIADFAGEPSEAEAYETDQEVMQLATATFYSDMHGGWDDVNNDGAAGYGDNVWGAEASDEGPGHYYPTAIALVGGHILTVSTTEFDPANPDNPTIEGAYGPATDQEIADHAIWMGLLANPAGEHGSSGGTADRELVSPLEGETSLYLQDFLESGMTGDDRNGVPAPGGSYCWIVGRNGTVYGAYEGGDGHWYAGFSGVYP
jgi:hypothetical protein